MRIISRSQRQDSDTKAVEVIVSSINKLLCQKDTVVLGLPGGRSVTGIFTLLKSEKNILWDKVHLFWVDERCVPFTDEESNYRLAKEYFLDELVRSGRLPKENIHPFDYRKGIDDYQQQLQQLGGKYDLCLFGVGEEGHIASLFPRHPALKDSSSYFLLINDAPKPPSVRMTMSVLLVKKIQIAIILFYGEGKKKAYEQFKDENVAVEECPAKVVLTVKEVYVVTDF